MNSWIEAIFQAFETLVQGVLVAVVLAYFGSTQRRFQSRFIQFGEAMRLSLQRSLRMKGDPLRLLRVPVLIGTIYFLGILGNVISFGILREAHERIIHDVYVAADADASGHFSSATAVRESSLWELTGIACDTIYRGLLRPLGWAATHTDDADRECYLRYMRDEMSWRNGNREAAAGSLENLLKQSRVARGTAVAMLLLAYAAALKLLILTTCLGVATSATRWPAVERRTAWLAHWLDRRFIRKDERLTGASDKGLDHRPVADIAIDTRRLWWTNLVVFFGACIIVMLAVGGYKMVEREYHMEVLYGASTLTTPQHPLVEEKQEGRVPPLLRASSGEAASATSRSGEASRRR